jgi:hypothetical protein
VAIRRWEPLTAKRPLEGTSLRDTVEKLSRESSLRHMEPEHLSSLPREGHVPAPQGERRHAPAPYW